MISAFFFFFFCFFSVWLKVKKKTLELFSCLLVLFSNSISQHRRENTSYICDFIPSLSIFAFSHKKKTTRISVMNIHRKLIFYIISFPSASLVQAVIILLNVASKAITYFLKILFFLSRAVIQSHNKKIVKFKKILVAFFTLFFLPFFCFLFFILFVYK